MAYYFSYSDLEGEIYMKLKKVKSSNISGVGYDAKKNTLIVEFNSGEVYEYQDVPVRMYHRLLLSPSKGKFFNQNIKQAFKYAKQTTA